MTDSNLRLTATPSQTIREIIRFLPLPCALIGALLIHLMVGTVSIPPGDVLLILLHKVGLAAGHGSWQPSTEDIVWQIRLPRILAAALVGASLALAGVLFQAVLRNPLADPYVIGTSAGAQLGVTVAFIAPLQFSLLGLRSEHVAAFLGAVTTVLLVYGLARTGGRTPVVTLILAGFVISSFLISATTFLTYAGPNVANHLLQVLNWTMGGIAVEEWSALAVAAPAILGAAACTFLLAYRLNLIVLGEQQAAHLGIRVERMKLVTIVLASLLTAFAVTLAGVVAFVGLVVPHAMRMLYGPGHRVLLPASALAGATFVVVCDLLAQIVVAPAEVPLGVVTAVFGAPLFLHLLRRSRHEYAF
jgi:iron complex transport system permease protein